jgi:suppressor for copper-sensitivity B
LHHRHYILHHMFNGFHTGRSVKQLGAHIAACLAALWVATADLAAAESGAWHEGEFAKARLVSSVEAVGIREVLRLGLQFRIQSGWKIYWRTPGDAGFPPQPRWSEGGNLAAVDMRWPAPLRFSIFDLQTLGYEDEVIFPLDVRLDRAGEALALDADVSYLICKEICVPETAAVALNLPVGPADPTSLANSIARFDSRVPGDGNLAGLSIQRASLESDGDKTKITVEAHALSSFVAPDLYVEGPDQLSFGAPIVQLSDGGRRAIITATSGGIDAARLADSGFVLTLVDGIRAMEQAVQISFTQGYSAEAGSAIRLITSAAPSRSLAMIVLLALLGGLILNLMPCVLPVLLLKFLGVVQHGGGERSAVRLNFLASTAGIIASFMLIAGALIALKAGGAAIGWGIQFQQPIFLVAMTVVVTLFACNLFGLFEVRLPTSMSRIAMSGASHSLGGNFLSGAFATLLATPCSAPFLGTAVGFALSRGPAETLVVFAALAIGLATPYLLVAAFPGLATRLPRPGRWMIWLRYVLGVALTATAVWLFFVLKQQVGTESMAIVTVMMGLIAVVFLTRRIDGSRLGQHAGKVVAGLAIAAIAIPLVRDASPRNAADNLAASDGQWLVFDRDEIDRLVKAGDIVFVDVTASWCITCQVNKKAVIETGDVAKWLSQNNVVAMRADWSQPDPMISQYLASYGRYGIPFNAIYGSQAPSGLVLPELLTSSAVLKAAQLAGSDFRLVAK